MPPDPQIRITPLARQPVQLYVRAGHPLAGRPCRFADAWRFGIAATRMPLPVKAMVGQLLTLLDAQAPVLAVTGMQHHDLIETFTQQDVDLTRVFGDVAVFNAQVVDAAHMENLASLACRSALARQGVAHLAIANDVQEQTLDGAERSKRNKPRHMPNRWFRGERVPSEAELGGEYGVSRVTVRRALEVLREEGLVTARQGVGWFVAVDPVRQALGRVTTIEEALEAAGSTPTRQVLEFTFEPAPTDVAKVLTEDGHRVVSAAHEALSALDEWTTGEIEAALRAKLVDELGLKPRNAFGPVRVAVTGRRISPPLFESLELLGREESLARLAGAPRAEEAAG